MEKQMRILSIGAHQDDADTSAAGLLWKLHDAGWQIRLLSLTDGSAGSYRLDLTREALARRRTEEAAASGRLLDARYDVFDNPDGQLLPTLANREALIRYIRRFRPDVIVTNRPNDYHADHRSTALLVQDASFLLTVPRICADTPCMTHTPPILFWSDSFQRPYPHRADLIVPMSEARVGQLTQLAACHECQYFDWLLWPDNMDKAAWPRDAQRSALRARFLHTTAAARDAQEAALIEKYGADTARSIAHVECYEISEYGADPTDEFRRIAEQPE